MNNIAEARTAETPKINGGLRAQQICFLFDQGHSIRHLSRLYGLSRTTVLDITMGRKYGDVTGRKPRDTKERNKQLGRKTSYWPSKKHWEAVNAESN